VLQFTPITKQHWQTLEPMMKAFWAFEQMPFSSDAALKVWQKAWERPEFVRGWLLEVESQVVGYVVLTFGFSLEYGGIDAFVDELFVKPEFRGQGFATKALEFLTLECRASNVVALHLEVDSTNEIAKNLYAKMGFESTARELLNKWLK
jgi:ribosomal protein S18 acetylase RimI-like enzyme